MNYSSEFTLNDWRGFGYICRQFDINSGKTSYRVQIGDKSAAWDLTKEQYWMLRELIELMETNVKQHSEQLNR
jgi:hypothetical protein